MGVKEFLKKGSWWKKGLILSLVISLFLLMLSSLPMIENTLIHQCREALFIFEDFPDYSYCYTVLFSFLLLPGIMLTLVFSNIVDFDTAFVGITLIYLFNLLVYWITSFLIIQAGRYMWGILIRKK